ncbi:hypothetical protein, partial [Gallibacterium anatis]|uniref:hypothetical protein n=1 Tax=Gallibacterium anatis TaxID=750 RepID=UPI001B32F4DF
QIWTPEGNQPGGQLTRHRQQLDQVAKFRSGRQKEINQVAKFRSGRQKEINQVANSPGTGSSSTRWPISYVRNQATLCEILAAIPRDYVI